jgi:probable rRNA maturation factor
MSFPIDVEPTPSDYRHLGDVVVCPTTAFVHAKGDNRLFWEELTLYIVHGLLHLLGYDDTTPKARAIMRRQERRALTLAKDRAFILQGPVSAKIHA